MNKNEEHSVINVRIIYPSVASRDGWASLPHRRENEFESPNACDLSGGLKGGLLGQPPRFMSK